MYKIIKKSKNPKYLIITPLKIGDKISKETKETVKKNNIQFDWVSYEGDNNIPTNANLALEEYEKENRIIDYIIKLDNDIKMSNRMLDKMFNTIKNSPQSIAYVYSSFQYILPNGQSINFNKEFDIEALLSQNYISSNSMIKRNVLRFVGGFVTDEKYVRLLDWALWLRFLYYGYLGKKVKDVNFTTPLNENNVSARGVEDYNLKISRIREDFVEPIINKMIKQV